MYKEECVAVLQAMYPVQQARLDVLAHPGNFDIIALLHQLTLQPQPPCLPRQPVTQHAATQHA